MMNESERARLWALILSVLVIVAALLVVEVNPRPVALTCLALLAGVVGAGLMSKGWGGLVASVVSVVVVGSVNYYAGIYPREEPILGTASELLAFLLVGPAAGILAGEIDRMQRHSDSWLALAEDQTVHDETFGTLKPRWAQVRLQGETLRAVNCSRPLAIVLLQLEPGPFAAVHDRAARIAALQAIIRLARAATRPPAVVAHAGGDRVLIILPEHTPQHASQLAMKLREQSVRAPYFPDKGRQSLGKALGEWGQVRIGLASLNGGSGTGETLFAQAVANLK